MNNSDWRFEFALPNLVLNRAFEFPFMAIVPCGDPRVTDICKSSDMVNRFLRSFINHRGDNIETCALISHVDIPTEIDITGLTAFRNAFAVSVLVKSWASMRIDEYAAPPDYTWADSFDFYPSTVRDERVVTIVPGMKSISSKEYNKFIGMASPHLHRPYPMNSLIYDEILYQATRIAWKKIYVEKSESKEFIALFRSLEMAYLALSSPNKNQASIFDHGSSIGQWVSAMEILVHPINDYANEKYVLDLLEEYEWASWQLNLKKYDVGNRKVNLISLIYHYLNKARNDFLHGNKITDNALKPFGENKPSIFVLAPVVYRTLLYEYARKFLGLDREASKKYFWNFMYEECLFQLLSKRIVINRFIENVIGKRRRRK